MLAFQLLRFGKNSVTNDTIALALNELSLEDRFLLQRHQYFSENLFSMSHECYLDAVEKMTVFLDLERSEQRSVENSTSLQSVYQTSSFPTFFHHTRLPRIEISKFSGSPADWLSFKDLFCLLILSNPSLSFVEKLQYLRTSLIGSAAHLLKNTSLTANNFKRRGKLSLPFTKTSGFSLMQLFIH